MLLCSKCISIRCIIVSALFIFITYFIFHINDANIFLNNVIRTTSSSNKVIQTTSSPNNVIHTTSSPNNVIDTTSLPSKPIASIDSKSNITSSQEFVRNNINNVETLFHAHWLEIIKHYIPPPLAGGFGSHQLALLAASILTAGDDKPVMEMGCGFFSTPLFDQIIVKEQKRYLLSTDTDNEWLSKFKDNMSSPLHHFRHVAQTSEWDEIDFHKPKWSIVFVDHKPGERRVVDIMRLINISDIVIVHDTETPSYNYEPGLALYPYRYRFEYIRPNTDVVSKINGELHRKIVYLLEQTINMKLPKQ